MKNKTLFYSFLLPAVLMAGTAQADPCQNYNRTVNFADGTARQAQGVACQGDDGVWRITQENIVPLAAPLPPQAVYVPPTYYAAPAPAYYPAAYYPPYYYDPFYYPSPYYGPGVSVGFVFHDHDHWGGGGGHWHH